MQLPNHTYYVIGAGGIGSWLIPQLAMLTDSRIVVMDADILELKNLSRQLFSKKHIGMSKAAAIAKIYKGVGNIEPVGEFLTESTFVDSSSVILCCADNHAARRNALRKADETGSTCIIGANETLQAEAYIYIPSMMADTPNDPRRFYPDIMTDESGNPVRPEGCTGHAQVETPQLVIANTTATSLMMRLLWWWLVEVPGRDQEGLAHWPVHHVATPQVMRTVKYGERS